MIIPNIGMYLKIKKYSSPGTAIIYRPLYFVKLLRKLDFLQELLEIIESVSLGFIIITVLYP